jgi:DNA-binding GntR family transcriptional regulator
MTAPLAHRTISTAIAERIRAGILDGTFPEGAQLRQDALAARFGVSRIPVREALFQLDAEGLVQMVPHKGAVVAGLSADEIIDIFDLRALLEPRLLASSLPVMDDADLDLADREKAAFAGAVRAGDRAAAGPRNAALHLALYRRARLPRTLAVVTGLMQASDRYTRLHLADAETMARAVREHDILLDLCRTRRTAEAVVFLTRHIDGVRDDLLRQAGGVRPGFRHEPVAG